MTTNKLFASALALTIGATGAWAQSQTSGEMATDSASTESMESTNMASNDDMSMDDRANLIRTRDITGGDIYTMNAANDEGWSMDEMHTEVGADWNDIGEIEDIILNKSGQMIGIVAEVGGFLDIADKHVMIPVSDVNLVAVDDARYAFLTRHSEEDLEQMESVDEGFWN
ncbi:MAG: PRC-barrel domain-containing protein [Pelagibaca sp.]